MRLCLRVIPHKLTSVCFFASVGDPAGGNGTEAEPANATSPLRDQDQDPAGGKEMSVSVSPVTTRLGGEAEEQSSGMFGEAAGPVLEEVGVATPPQLSPDSAESEHLLPGNPVGAEVMEGGEEGDDPSHTDPPWIHAKDTAVFDLDHLFTTAAPPAAATNPSNPDVLHVDFFDPSSHGRSLDLAPPSPSLLAHELQGGDPTSWAMPDNYDYLTPYEDSASPTADQYAYSTTTDTYESDEDLRLSAGSQGRPQPGSFMPGAGAPLPNAPAAAPPAASPVDGSDGAGGCRVGFQMVSGRCRSPCDVQPNFCFNGGQCYLLEGAGAFCRYGNATRGEEPKFCAGVEFGHVVRLFLSCDTCESTRVR